MALRRPICVFPVQFRVMPSTEESLEICERYEKRGGDRVRLVAWVSQLMHRPSRSQSNVKRWRKSIGAMLSWSGLPEKYKPFLDELRYFLDFTIESPPLEPMRPEGIRLRNLVAAVLFEEFRRRFPGEKIGSTMGDVRELLVASVPTIFPQAKTSAESLRKLIQRVPHHVTQRYHSAAFPGSI